MVRGYHPWESKEERENKRLIRQAAHKLSMAEMERERVAQSSTGFTVPRPGKCYPYQSVADARRRYRKRQRLTETGRNVVVGLVATVVIIVMVVVYRIFPLAVQVAQQ